MSSYILKYGDQKLAQLCKNKIVATYFHPLSGWAEITREAAFVAAECTLIPSFNPVKAYGTGEYTEIMQGLIQQRGQQEVSRTIRLVGAETPWMRIVEASLTLSNYYLLPLFFDLLEPGQVFVLPFRTGASAEALRSQRLWKQLCATNNKRVDLVLVEAKHIEAAKLRVEGVAEQETAKEAADEPAFQAPIAQTDAELVAELEQQAVEITEEQPVDSYSEEVAAVAHGTDHAEELVEALHEMGAERAAE